MRSPSPLFPTGPSIRLSINDSGCQTSCSDPPGRRRLPGRRRGGRNRRTSHRRRRSRSRRGSDRGARCRCGRRNRGTSRSRTHRANRGSRWNIEAASSAGWLRAARSLGFYGLAGGPASCACLPSSRRARPYSPKTAPDLIRVNRFRPRSRWAISRPLKRSVN